MSEKGFVNAFLLFSLQILRNQKRYLSLTNKVYAVNATEKQVHGETTCKNMSAATLLAF